MLKGGLVSVTFRQLQPTEIVELVSKSGLECIEWGGDVHVPHGDIKRAQQVHRMTLDAGLRVSSYGSYYRVAESEAEGLNFESVLASAQELGAPIIRVWAGRRASEKADRDYRQKVVADSLRIADLASAVGISIAYEYHAETLTDTNESASRLLEEVNHPSVSTFWQPPVDKSEDYCAAGLRNILPRLASLHVFHWEPRQDGINRRQLAEGGDHWRRYLRVVSTGGHNHDALIEFVSNDSPEQFLADAQTLRSWMDEANRIEES